MCTTVSPLEYRESVGDKLALPAVSSPAVAEPSSPVVVGVAEDEVDRRLQIVRDAAVAEADERVRIECERFSKRERVTVTAVLEKFSEERAEYFMRVEGEVVQLALAIARKILQREAELDPTLLAALVRIATDRMQCDSAVRVRVAPENAELWRECGEDKTGSRRWEIVPDQTLNSDDCIVETELGTANFGFETQLRDVEESFARLLAHRPHEQSRYASRA
jgi:flagellar assembly protein FliH